MQIRIPDQGTELSLSNSLTDLAARIAEAHAHVARAMQTGLANAKIAGELLIEAKQTVPHGQWEDWITSNCQFSARTAQAYMRIARLAPAKAQRVADLSLREATRALAKPKTPMLPAPPPSTPAEWIDIERYDFGMPLHPASKAFPMVSPDELADIADSIKENGLLFPLTLYKGSLLDGKLRLVACRMAGVEPRFVTLPDDKDPRAFVWSMNGCVTHLTPSQCALMKARLHLDRPDLLAKYHADRPLLEMAIYVLQHAPSYFEPLRDGVLRLAEVYEQVRAEQDEADRRAQAFADLRAEAPDLAERVTAGRMQLADAVAIADERREQAHRAQMFDASADLLKALAKD